eukprot:9390667-Alexandrium_andersonii.AAC.1
MASAWGLTPEQRTKRPLSRQDPAGGSKAQKGTAVEVASLASMKSSVAGSVNCLLYTSPSPRD